MGERVPGMTLREIAEGARTTHTRVRHLIMRGLIPHDTVRRRQGVPADVGSLITAAIKIDAVSPTTAELMRDDPAQVMEGAFALAELASRALAEKARQTKTAITERSQAA